MRHADLCLAGPWVGNRVAGASPTTTFAPDAAMTPLQVQRTLPDFPEADIWIGCGVMVDAARRSKVSEAQIVTFAKFG